MSNSNFEAANVGNEGSFSNRNEKIKGLNEDLPREYKEIGQYVVFSSTLKGGEYQDRADQLKNMLHRSLHML
jgi:hypothetical protein